MSYIAGHYKAKYALHSSSPAYVDIGSTQDGFHLHIRNHVQNVQDDAYGDARPDVILQGVDYAVSGIMIEMDKLIASPPLVMFTQELQGAVNANVGHRGSDVYGILQLTPVAGTPAATLLGVSNSYFFWAAGVANDIDLLLASKLAHANLTWECLPSAANSNLAYGIASSV